MKIRLLVLISVIIVIGAILQQFSLFTSHRQTLETRSKEAAKLVTRIESAMYQEATLKQQLAEAEQLNVKLRQLLPETLQVDELKQQVADLASKHDIKILATKTATRSRPGYSVATTDITLEAGTTATNHFMRELNSIPRRIHIITAGKRGQKSINLTITTYAVNKLDSAALSMPRCIEMQWGILLPPLRNRLMPQYEEYDRLCRFVENYASHYLNRQHLIALQQDNARLAALEQQLRSRP